MRGLVTAVGRITGGLAAPSVERTPYRATLASTTESSIAEPVDAPVAWNRITVGIDSRLRADS